MSFFSHPSRRAFTLVELLVVLPLFALLTCGLARITVDFVELHSRLSDEAAARARANRVRSVLGGPIAHCAYGMPGDGAAYRNVFPQSRDMVNSFYTWPAPISAASSAVAFKERKNGACRIVYAIPSRLLTTKAALVSGDRFTVELTGKPTALDPVYPALKPNHTKNWAVFGSATPQTGPFWLAAFGGANTVILRRAAAGGVLKQGIIPQNDELYYLRATEAKVSIYRGSDWALYTNNQDGSGRQPRVEGVVDARFAVSPSGRSVKVWLLVRGDRRGKVKTAIPAEWPAEFANDIPDEARLFNLYAFELTLGLRNYDAPLRD